MMGRMARTGSGARGALASLALLFCVTVAACTTDQPAQPSPSTPESAALRVRTVHVAGELDADAQAEAESAIGDVLSGYVVRGFLGDYQLSHAGRFQPPGRRTSLLPQGHRRPCRCQLRR